MSKISYPQLVKDVADAVRTGTKTTDLIPAGELADTILALLTRNPSSGETSVVTYKSITYNDDNTVTLIDQDDIEHTMLCEYDGDKLIAVSLDGKDVSFTYDDENLIKVGSTAVDMKNAPVTEVVEGTLVKASFDIAPNFKGIVDAKPSSALIIDIVGLSAYIVGEGKVGETLSVASDSINLDMCDFQWFSGCTKYSHTPNINDEGVQNGNYAHSYTNTEVITIEGEESLTVTIKYDTERNYDYITIFEGNHPDYTYSTAGYIKQYSGKGEETFTVTGDSVTFAFKSDGSNASYGYYAKIGNSKVIEGATNKEYIVQTNDTFIFCSLYGRDDYYGTLTTETVSIKE
jgi:hypothetical protein